MELVLPKYRKPVNCALSLDGLLSNTFAGTKEMLVGSSTCMTLPKNILKNLLHVAWIVSCKNKQVLKISLLRLLSWLNLLNIAWMLWMSLDCANSSKIFLFFENSAATSTYEMVWWFHSWQGKGGKNLNSNCRHCGPFNVSFMSGWWEKVGCFVKYLIQLKFAIWLFVRW